MKFLIAIFILCVIAEFIISRKKNLNLYQLKYTLSHVFTGLGQQVLNLGLMVFLPVLYAIIQKNFGAFDIAGTDLFTLFTLFVLVDFAFYWAHRAGHRVNLFIIGHGVHHQAPDFNFGSSLRQGWFARPLMFLFYLPLALIGFRVELVLACLMFNLGVQFLSHCGLYKKSIPWLEKVFVTPYVHEIHHATNGPYLDKNYGGVLTIWDHCFGTFQGKIESLPLVIGPENPERFVNPVLANLYYLNEVRLGVRAETGFKAKLALIFKTPEYLESKRVASKFNPLVQYNSLNNFPLETQNADSDQMMGSPPQSSVPFA